MQFQNIYHNCLSPNPLIYTSFWYTYKIIFNCILKDTEEMEAGGKHIFFDNGDNMCFYFVKNAVGRGMG